MAILHNFKGIFPGGSVLADSLGFLSPLVPTLIVFAIIGTDFFAGWMSVVISSVPTNIVKALKQSQSTSTNQR